MDGERTLGHAHSCLAARWRISGKWVPVGEWVPSPDESITLSYGASHTFEKGDGDNFSSKVFVAASAGFFVDTPSGQTTIDAKDARYISLNFASIFRMSGTANFDTKLPGGQIWQWEFTVRASMCVLYFPHRLYTLQRLQLSPPICPNHRAVCQASLKMQIVSTVLVLRARMGAQSC